jgi:predicted deacylase
MTLLRAPFTLATVLVVLDLVSSGLPQGSVKVPSAKAAPDDVKPGVGVSAVRRLSDYSPAVAGTAGDTPVYVMDGNKPGGTMLVLGGTHANEIAGIMAAVVMVEHARVQRGRLIVIPHANNSAITDVDPERPGPESITIKTPTGERRFRYGSRRTKLADQGEPDPARYRHPKSDESLDGTEARNLNRAYPGRADGNLTERIAFAIMAVLKREGADLAFDLHEAGPESRLAWMIVANPKNIEVAATAVLALEAEGIAMKLEPSSEVFRGLSHREWGDETKAQAFLFETPSPGQVTNTRGADVVNDAKLPLNKRVGVQLSCLSAVLVVYNEAASRDRQVGLSDVPSEGDVVKAGVGAFLK